VKNRKKEKSPQSGPPLKEGVIAVLRPTGCRGGKGGEHGQVRKKKELCGLCGRKGGGVADKKEYGNESKPKKRGVVTMVEPVGGRTARRGGMGKEGLISKKKVENPSSNRSSEKKISKGEGSW